jgi:hypothetical protein
MLANPDVREPPSPFWPESPEHDHQPVAIEYYVDSAVVTERALHHLTAERGQPRGCDPSLWAGPALAMQMRYEGYQDVGHLALKHDPEGFLKPEQVQMSSDRSDGLRKVGNIVREPVLGQSFERRLGEGRGLNPM